MHMGAVQREQQWKERALAGEQISKQLLVVVAWCVQQIGALTRQLAWLKKQQFGSKSEASQPSDRVADEGGVVAETAQDAEPAETGTKHTGPSDPKKPRATAWRQRSQTPTPSELTSGNHPAHGAGD
jgi:hypothetical protein